MNLRRVLFMLAVIIISAMMTISCAQESKEPNEVDGLNQRDYTETYLFGYIDRDGSIVIEPQYPEAHEFSEGLALVACGGLVYIDHSGEAAIELDVISAEPFSEGLAAVLSENDGLKWGYIDKNGNYIIEPMFGRAQSFSEGLARIWLVGSAESPQGFIDKTGEFVILPELEGTETDGGFYDGRSLIAKKTYYEGVLRIEYGFIDKDNVVVVEPQYYSADRFSEGLASVMIDGKWGYIDVNGNTVIEPRFDDASIFSEGLAAIELDGKWGYISSIGEMVIQPQYDAAGIFSEGLAAVRLDGKWGYIDRDGNIVIDHQYEEAGYFSEGLAPVRF